jgi:hypothetical protein
MAVDRAGIENQKDKEHNWGGSMGMITALWKFLKA